MGMEEFRALEEDRKVFLYRRIKELQKFLATGAPTTMITVDGVQVMYDRAGAREELKTAWEELKRLEGAERPNVMDIEME